MRIADHWCFVEQGVDQLLLDYAHNFYIFAFIKFLFKIPGEFIMMKSKFRRLIHYL